MNVTLNITTDNLDDVIATLSAIKAGLGFEPRQVAAGATDPAAGATSSQTVILDADLAAANAAGAEYSRKEFERIDAETRALAQQVADVEPTQGECPQIGPTAPPPPAPAGAPDGDAELDERGMPWDARIHASTKSKLASGNWKNKRGVDAAELEAVEAELLGTNAATDITAPTPPPPAPAAEPQQAATPPPPVAATAGAETVETFPQLMHYIQSKGLGPDQYLPYVQAFNLAALPDLLKPENAGVIPQLHAALAGA